MSDIHGIINEENAMNETQLEMAKKVIQTIRRELWLML